MGTVYARGEWLWLGFRGPDGRWYYRSARLKVGREPEAHAKLAEIESAVAVRTETAPAPLTYTVADWAERWAQRRIEKGKWTNAKLDKKALEQHVVAAVVDVHDKPVHLGRLRLEEVRVVHVRAWLETMEAKKLAPNTVISAYSLMSRMFKAAVGQELLETSPCLLERGELPRLSAGSAPQDRQEQAMFTLRELEQLISDTRIPLDRRVAYAVCCLGGLREGELAALTWADYDEALEPLGRLYVSKSYTRKNKRVKSTKSGADRWVPVHQAVAALLAQWKLSGWGELFGRRPKATDLLVPNRAGRFLTDLNLWGNLQHDLKVLGWRLRTFHDTRATFCTYAMANGGVSWDLVKHITHGVNRRSRRMVEVYVRPPWHVLCGIVQGIKLQLRGESAPVPLRAAVGSLHSATTEEEVMAPTPRPPNDEASVPRARFELARKSPPGPDRDGNSHASELSSTTEPRRSASDCSESTTKPRRLRPLVGGRLRPFRKPPKGGES